MTIFGQKLNETAFPSYTSPSDTPTHRYGDMQDTLRRALDAPAIAQPIQMQSAEQKQHQWK